ncbi:hypothetical protein CALCODRAFT_508698 [Calocera cornea HHB12733]|uniref:Uncharacterized protein n=1 Tax=Calocera cornea HHB12733 TaxID=1353952 RepID=A0A165G4E1_9BASI|nr:hypothetical protein CALCODRAFT_508698 [Calocera cornea HHB12733]
MYIHKLLRAGIVTCSKTRKAYELGVCASPAYNASAHRTPVDCLEARLSVYGTDVYPVRDRVDAPYLLPLHLSAQLGQDDGHPPQRSSDFFRNTSKVYMSFPTTPYTAGPTATNNVLFTATAASPPAPKAATVTGEVVAQMAASNPDAMDIDPPITVALAATMAQTMPSSSHAHSVHYNTSTNFDVLYRNNPHRLRQLYIEATTLNSTHALIMRELEDEVEMLTNIKAHVFDQLMKAQEENNALKAEIAFLKAQQTHASLPRI